MSNRYELDRLKAELAQERQMKEMLDQSTNELQLTVNELEKRIEAPGNLDGENNEWKTRYEMQVELNQQLTKQIGSLSEKVDDARETYNKSKLPKSSRGQGDIHEVTPYYLKQLEREKQSINGQLRDLEWRLDQESKAYHKSNEERKQHLVEINSAKNNIDFHIRRTGDTPRHGANTNIPQDMRIIDPKYGPIKKTAAVKSLPHIQ